MISQESIEKFKVIYKEETGKELNDREAFEAANNLVNFFDLLLKFDYEDKKRKERLKKEPKGFHLEGEGYTCKICNRSISDKETWYDKYGIKCLNCQKTQNKKTITTNAVKD
jgi:hypothetical protein